MLRCQDEQHRGDLPVHVSVQGLSSYRKEQLARSVGNDDLIDKQAKIHTSGAIARGVARVAIAMVVVGAVIVVAVVVAAIGVGI